MIETAKAHEIHFAAQLLDEVMERGFSVHTAALDKGYDMKAVYDSCEARGVHAVIPLRANESVKKGWHEPPSCEHGVWRFAGADYKRSATKCGSQASSCVISTAFGIERPDDRMQDDYARIFSANRSRAA